MASAKLVAFTTLCFDVLASDFRYYQADTADWTDTSGNCTVTGWNGFGSGENDVVLFDPTIARITLQPDGIWPAEGQPFYSRSDVTYVVMAGDASFGGVSGSLAHGHGDVFWASAGTTYGPIRSIGSEKLVVAAVTGGGRDALSPDFGDAPEANPSTHGQWTTQRSYRAVDGNWTPNPSPHSQACEDAGGVHNVMFRGVDLDSPVLGVKFGPSCSIPVHNHPTGALYFIHKGRMGFKGDHPDRDSIFETGDIRWVRPGFTYGPEYNAGDDELQITVLGTDTQPDFDPSKVTGNYHVRKLVYVDHVYPTLPAQHHIEV